MARRKLRQWRIMILSTFWQPTEEEHVLRSLITKFPGPGPQTWGNSVPEGMQPMYDQEYTRQFSPPVSIFYSAPVIRRGIFTVMRSNFHDMTVSRNADTRAHRGRVLPVSTSFKLIYFCLRSPTEASTWPDPGGNKESCACALSCGHRHLTVSMLPPILFLAASAALAQASFIDPCTVASSSTRVSSKTAHACKLNVPFDKTRSLAVIDSNIKALPYYTLETWFRYSPNPLIPQNVDIRSLLLAVQQNTSAGAYETDRDFNMAITDAWNHLGGGHTAFVASCTEAFSYSLPFSIGILAATPTSATAYPIFLANYDFPNQVRTELEAYYESLGVAPTTARAS
ncbi:hypothetical protein MVEN_02513400 [Mycena venus]|uniref:Uncharacterized protein n=1 Tax=Mycena venus TaxID=2733690 RepID=A0A8H6U575_9AGAR|nr:hypothetical protein MVEN_02513400 [Mycena venus]